MKKIIKVHWVEYHSQTIEADPERDDLLMQVEVNDMATTYETCSLRDVEIMGEIERDDMYESHKWRENQ